MSEDKQKQQSEHDKSVFQGYIINEKGEEVPITQGMVDESLKKAKLKSIGAHTGYTKAITDDMLPAKEKLSHTKVRVNALHLRCVFVFWALKSLAKTPIIIDNYSH
jgi:hypothetical protein